MKDLYLVFTESQHVLEFHKWESSFQRAKNEEFQDMLWAHSFHTI